MKLGADRSVACEGWRGVPARQQFGSDAACLRHSQLNGSSSKSTVQRPLSCRASLTLERLPLSNYDFPELPSGAVEATPLESAVKEAVKHIEQAPFLQLQHGTYSTRHDVSNRVLEDQQVWDHVAETLEKRGAEVVLLVHRLDPVEPDRVRRRVGNTSNVMTGITNASQGRLESFAELLQTETSRAEFSGRVGDCCDEDMVSQVVPFTRPGQSRHRHSSANSVLERSQSWRNERANYWGVVLQSRTNERDSGCYVLKTVHSGVGDCTCVHWTLTRVRQGASFFEQLNSAWLL